MSLAIPNAPNSGLFKQGYQKYLALNPTKARTADPCLVTNLKMVLL